MDQPLSSDAIRLLDERDRSLQAYLSAASPQSAHATITLLGDSTDEELGRVPLPQGDARQLKFTVEGTVQVNNGATAYAGQPTVVVWLWSSSGTPWTYITAEAANSISNTSGSDTSYLSPGTSLFERNASGNYTAGEMVVAKANMGTVSGGANVSFDVDIVVTISPVSEFTS